jgi:hypothetical protein
VKKSTMVVSNLLTDKEEQNRALSEEELIEPEQNPEGDERIEEPYDPTKSKVDTKPMTVDLLIKRIQEGEIDLKPPFQRRAGLWSDEQKSRLIESLLIRIPLPAFYFDATDESKWVVVDGLQRLTVFEDFVLRKMRLDNLEFLTQYDQSSFKELPRPLRRRIEESQVTVHLIQPGTPAKAKFIIFRRINTGGLVLTSQEIRHALNQGPAIGLLDTLASSDEFRKATLGSIPTDRMADREFVLRFLAFTRVRYSDYKVPDMDAFLNEQMANLNRMDENKYQDLVSRFKRAMRVAYDLFGDDAFRKRYSKEQRRHPINKALFESWSVRLGQLSDAHMELLVTRKGEVIRRAMNLLNDDREFDQAITQGTKDVKKVQKRFRAIELLVDSILEEHAHADRG